MPLQTLACSVKVQIVVQLKHRTLVLNVLKNERACILRGNLSLSDIKQYENIRVLRALF